MSGVKAGVVLITKFVSASSAKFSSYVDYIDRDNATRNDNTDKYAIDDLKNQNAKFNEYMDYMGDDEKTTDLFTESKDSLTADEKATLKNIFKTAQQNQSLMWQTVISFDNNWLEEYGLYNSESEWLDERKLKDYTRGCMNKMLGEEVLADSSIWSAAIHYNTDNVHIHIATVEPIPTRKKIKEGEYAGQVKGTFRQSSIKAGKSYIVNNITNYKEINNKINNIIRKDILDKKKNNPLINEKKLVNQFLQLHSMLPSNRKEWNYKSIEEKHKQLKPLLDDLSKSYLDKRHKKDMKELKSLVKLQENEYRTAYGTDAENNFAENKMQDTYKRLGNLILKDIREYDKDIKTEISKKQFQSKTTRRQHAPKFNQSAGSAPILQNAIMGLMRNLDNEIAHIKNQLIYEQEQRKAVQAEQEM